MQPQSCSQPRASSACVATEMRSPKRVSTAGILASIVLPMFALATSAGAADDPAPSFPQRPVRMLVGFAAGGATDIIARIVAEKLSARWQQSVVRNRRPGTATYAAQARRTSAMNCPISAAGMS